MSVAENYETEALHSVVATFSPVEDALDVRKELQKNK
jgi:hypothetical protein